MSSSIVIILKVGSIYVFVIVPEPLAILVYVCTHTWRMSVVCIKEEAELKALVGSSFVTPSCAVSWL